MTLYYIKFSVALSKVKLTVGVSRVHQVACMHTRETHVQYNIDNVLSAVMSGYFCFCFVQHFFHRVT